MAMPSDPPHTSLAAAMDRLARLRSELADEKACAKNQSLTQSTRKDCKENAELMRCMLADAASRVLMERSMMEISVVDTAPGAKPDAVAETPYYVVRDSKGAGMSDHRWNRISPVEPDITPAP
jgi:hypothetical protein|eukprot:7390885-Prymnesium_polylepis.1